MPRYRVTFKRDRTVTREEFAEHVITAPNEDAAFDKAEDIVSNQWSHNEKERKKADRLLAKLKWEHDGSNGTMDDSGEPDAADVEDIEELDPKEKS